MPSRGGTGLASDLTLENLLLRRQSPNFDKTSFLSGPSEMARRIREFDWSEHPLGPSEDWSAALRSALSIALNSAFPTCIYWGPELRLLYNDSWSHIPGPRHPGCLGEPATEVWSDIWHVIEPQLAEAISTGEGVYFRDQMLPMLRFGVEEETYWTYNFTPIRDDDGSIGGIFNSGNETTRQVLQQENNRFLLELSDVFRNMTDLAELRQRAIAMLGAHLGVDRAGLRERVQDGRRAKMPVTEQWVADGALPVPSGMARAPVLDAAWQQLLDGRVIQLDGTDPTRAAIDRTMLDLLNCEAALAVPWVEDGRTEAILFVHSCSARHWTDLELEMVEQVLSRMMAVMDRARAAERERLMSDEINHRSRNLLAVVQGIVRLARPEEPEVMRAKLIDRLGALAQNHSLLADQRWEPVALSRLLAQELSPYASGGEIRVDMSGPAVALSSEECQTLGMVVHELVTNAAKHGALKDAGGALEVSWEVTDGRLHLDWIETVSGPLTREGFDVPGFGSSLMRLMIERQLEGKLVRELTPQGLRCVIDVPWARRDASQREPADRDEERIAAK